MPTPTPPPPHNPTTPIEACRACPEAVEITPVGTRCAQLGGRTRSCPRCWANYQTGRCPLNKWEGLASPQREQGSPGQETERRRDGETQAGGLTRRHAISALPQSQIANRKSQILIPPRVPTVRPPVTEAEWLTFPTWRQHRTGYWKGGEATKGLTTRLARQQVLPATTPPPTPMPLYLSHGKDAPPTYLTNLLRGRPAFLLCGGPSVAELNLDLLRQPGVWTMAVNNATKTFRSNAMVHVDKCDSFLRSVWEDPAIMKFTPIGLAGGRIFDSSRDQWTDHLARDCPSVFFYHRRYGFDPATFLTGESICWGNDDKHGGGRSVMHVALRLLFELGARTVFLLGADFHMAAERSYHFDEPKGAVAARGNNGTYRTLQKRFTQLRPIFDAAGFAVYNCNPASKLTAFDHVPFAQAVAFATAAAGNIDPATEPTAGLYTRKRPKFDKAQALVDRPTLKPARHPNAPYPTTPPPNPTTTSKYDVTLITPTGDRPEAFALCERWIRRQAFAGRVQWIVVDDGNTPTVCTLGQQHIRRPRTASDPRHTLPVNLLAALPHVQSNKVLIIEDDDWYAPHYVQTMVRWLDDAELVGESHAIYYRPDLPAWKGMNNPTWASLAATGFCGPAVLKFVADFCRHGQAFIDLHVWRHFSGVKRIHRRTGAPMIVQMKGMPGRPGQIRHHTAPDGFHLDPGRAQLRKWIGSDVAAYGPGVPPNAAGGWFSHSGKIGDLVYALPTIRAMGGGNLRLFPRADMPWTDAQFQSVRPLLECQPYITRVVRAQVAAGVNLDVWRDGRRRHELIADSHLQAFGLPTSHRDTPWLTVPEPRHVARVVIHRSLKYHNPSFPWARLIEEHRNHLVMVGTRAEHAVFCSRFGDVVHHQTDNLLEVARAIAGAELFIGNQSAPLAIAHALGQNVIIEQWESDRNATYARKGEKVL